MTGPYHNSVFQHKNLSEKKVLQPEVRQGMLSATIEMR
jgi:hypothetical protein